MIARPLHAIRPFAVLIVSASLVAGCALGTPRSSSRPSAAAASACRQDVDRVYSAQNRGDLSMRDQRDTPFAMNYLPGNTSRGLGQEYGRDKMFDSCLANANSGSAPAAQQLNSTGPAFSPVAQQLNSTGPAFSPVAK